MPNWTECDGCGKLYYERTGGNKPALLLAHGLTDSGECWNPVIEVLRQDYDIITWDAPGHGRSDLPKRDFTVDGYLEGLHKFIGSLKLDKPVLMGHSMGAVMVTRLAAKYPGLASAVILEDPAWLLESPMAEEFDWTSWIHDLQSHTMDEVIDLGHSAHPTWSAQELRPWARSKLQFRTALFDGVPPARADDWRQSLASIPCPVLLVTGEPRLGGLITAEAAGEAERHGRQVKTVCIADAGHNIRREQFVLYMKAVTQFLREQQVSR